MPYNNHVYTCVCMSACVCVCVCCCWAGIGESRKLFEYRKIIVDVLIGLPVSYLITVQALYCQTIISKVHTLLALFLDQPPTCVHSLSNWCLQM